MSWDSIHGQELAKRIWQVHLAAGEVADAYLLVGPEGVGKRLLAGELAKTLNCAAKDARPCGICPSCTQIEKRIHPDVHWLQPEGAAGLIKIDPVRRILARIALRPFSGRYQVVLVDGVERLTEEAANTLLKSIEEPQATTRFLLMTAQRSRCLPTIVSRCQLIRCRRLTPEVITRILAATRVCDDATASAVSRLAGGSMARALEYIGRWTSHQQMVGMFGGDAQAWLDAPLPETREEVQQLLDGMTVWLRDVTVTSAGGPQWVAHGTEAGALDRAAQRLDRDRCVETAFELVHLRESLERFVSPRLVASLARESWLNLLQRA